ncbi:MAG: V-type ATP synthase subunit A, partial [Pseudomonadota bacterium]
QQKALFLDMVYLQQDAFDAVDATVPLERQKLTFHLVRQVIDTTFDFESKAAARGFFTRLTSDFKNFHYAADGTPDYGSYLDRIKATLKVPEPS